MAKLFEFTGIKNLHFDPCLLQQTCIIHHSGSETF